MELYPPSTPGDTAQLIPKRMGASMGAFDSAMDLSLFVGPLVAVSVFKSTGQTALVFLIAVLPAVFAFFATVAWLPRKVIAIDWAEQPERIEQ